MGEARHRVLPAKGAVEQHVERCRRQPLLAADDVRHLHQVVVDDVGQMVGRQLVGALPQHLIVEDRAVDADVAANYVVDVHILARLDEEADDVGVPLGDEAVGIFLAECQRVAHLVARRGVVLEVLHLLALGGQFLGRIEGDVGASGVEELADIFLIDFLALALAVRAVVAAEADAFVELNAEPAERLQDIFLGTGHEACGVGVLDAEDELAAVLAGEEIVVESSADTTDVEGSCG